VETRLQALAAKSKTAKSAILGRNIDFISLSLAKTGPPV
jgi:hypothetical protein